jgi:hypothetical protein
MGLLFRDMRSWLLQVGRNWLRDVARRQKVATRSVEHLDTLAGSRQEPSSDVENQELHLQVRKELAQMKLEDREVLLLRYSLGWSSNSIATALNSTTSAVDMRLSRARKKLAEKFDKAEHYCPVKSRIVSTILGKVVSGNLFVGFVRSCKTGVFSKGLTLRIWRISEKLRSIFSSFLTITTST